MNFPDCLNIVFPSCMINHRNVDEFFMSEKQVANGLFNTITDSNSSKEPSLYRGWMLSKEDYEGLTKDINLIVSPDQYVAAHYFSGSYWATHHHFVRADRDKLFEALQDWDEPVFIRDEIHHRSQAFKLEPPFTKDKVEAFEKAFGEPDIAWIIRPFVELEGPEFRSFWWKDKLLIAYERFSQSSDSLWVDVLLGYEKNEGINFVKPPEAVLRVADVLSERLTFYTIDWRVQNIPEGKAAYITEIGDGQVSEAIPALYPALFKALRS